MSYEAIVFSIPIFCIVLSSCATSNEQQVLEAQKKNAQIKQEANLEQECSSLFKSDFDELTLPSLYEGLNQSVPAKDEFETWSAFNERAKAATSDYDQLYYIPIKLNEAHVSYNADNETLNFGEKAFGQTYLGETFSVSVTSRFREFTGSDGFSLTEIVNGKTLGFVTESEEIDSYTYTGGNAFGTSTQVNAYTEESFGVFENLKIWEEPYTGVWASFFSRNLENKSNTVASVSVASDRAKQLKGSFHAVVILKPKAPYTLEHTDFKSATFSSPYSNTDKQKYVVADMKCIAIVSGNEVFHVQATL